MERRTLIAVGVSLFILVIYQGVILPTLYPPKPRAEQQEIVPPVAPQSEDVPAAPAVVAPDAPAEAAAPADAATATQAITVETDRYVARLTNRGARFESFGLKKYRTSLDRQSPPQELIIPAAKNEENPVAVELRGIEGGDQGRIAVVNDTQATYSSSESREHIALSGEQSVAIEYRWSGPLGTITKTYTFYGDRPTFALAVDAESLPPQYRELGVTYVSGGKSGKEAIFDRTSYLQGRKVVEHHLGASALTEGEIVPADPGFLWTAIDGRYFIAALIPLDARNPRLWLKQRGDALEQKILFPLTSSELHQRFDVYLGAKRIQTLEAAGHNLNLAVNMGWFGFISVPLLWILRHSHRVTNNYGIDIILLVVMLKVLFLPLTRKSFQSMREMQKLQPQLTQLRERLKDKPDEMNKETMELYRRHGVNPLGGCLPMLVQIPVFIGLYQALLNAVELRHAPFFWWINDLSAPDRLGSMQIPFIDPPGIPVLTLVMGATMFLQQKMTPSTGDPTQRQMMMIMPLLFTFMFVSFPAGLVLYWTVNNVLTVAQQYWITRSAT